MRTATTVAALWPIGLFAASIARAEPPAGDGGTAASSGKRCALTVRGRVLDADLDTPIAEAVVVTGVGDTSVRTDADGWFALTVCRGSTTISISKAGFLTARRIVDAPRARPLTVRLPFAMQSLVITAPAADPLASLGFTDQLDGKVLAETRGLSLSDALSESTGVQVLRVGAVAKPVIDGFYGNRILILNDGLRHHAQLWALDHAPEIDPFSAARLTVVRGADGVRYGADALGGTILVEPMAFRDRSQPGVGGEVNLVGISNGRQGIANAAVSGTVWGLPRWSLRLQGSVKKSGSLDAPDYPIDNTGSEDFAGGAGLRYQGDGWQASVAINHLASDYGVFTGIRSESPRDFEDAINRDEPQAVDLFEFSYNLDRPFSEVRHLYARAKVQADVSDWATVKLKYGYQHNERKEFEVIRDAASNPQLTFDLYSHALEATFEHRIDDRISGAIGISGLLQRNDHEGRPLIPDYDRLVGGVFGLERYRVQDGFEVAIGLRYERQSLDTEEPARVAPRRNPPSRFSLDFEAIMATLGFTYKPDDAWRFEAHFAGATRIPSLDELFILGLVPGEVFFIAGDNTLQPERTANLGLGAAFAHRWFDAEVTAYAHAIADYIYRAPALNAFGEPEFRTLITGRHPELEYRNVNALYVGGTIDLDVHPVPWLTWRARASYIRARNLTDGTFLINIPPDRYENRLTLRPAKGWGRGWAGALEYANVWVESVWVRSQDEFDINADFRDPPPAYHLLNAGLGTAFSFGPHEVRATVDLQNLLNTSYRDYLSRLRFFADEPGFSAIVRIGVPFDVPYGAPKSTTFREEKNL